MNSRVSAKPNTALVTMKNYASIALLAVVTLAAIPMLTQAESKGAEAARFRWDIAPGMSIVSGGEVGLTSSVTLAYDTADRRISYRFIEYSDRAIFGSKGICPLGCGHQDLLDTHELLYGWLHTSGLARFSLQSGVGHTRANGYFGELGSISEPILPLVAGMVVGDELPALEVRSGVRFESIPTVLWGDLSGDAGKRVVAPR